jgi:transcription elongation factor Elf1
MNYTPLNDAYNIHHINSNTYTQSIQYSSQCIFCGNEDTTALMLNQDNGAFRHCNNPSCRKNFRATILSKPISNYTKATTHLKGTN